MIKSREEILLTELIKAGVINNVSYARFILSELNASEKALQMEKRKELMIIKIKKYKKNGIAKKELIQKTRFFSKEERANALYELINDGVILARQEKIGKSQRYSEFYYCT